MWDNGVLKGKAKERLHGNYWKLVLAALITSIAIGGSVTPSITANFNSLDSDMNYYGTGIFGQAFSYMMTYGAIIAAFLVGASVVGILVRIFLLNPLLIGGNRYFYQNIYEDGKFNSFGVGFDGNYLEHVKIMFLRDLFTDLWTLLFIIPGIVKSYEYRMIPYLLADHPDMKYEDAFAISKRMMDGNKLDAFWFDLTFIGWQILSICTFGILGIFYVNPYYYQSCAMLYDALKIEDQKNNTTNDTFDQFDAFGNSDPF